MKKKLLLLMIAPIVLSCYENERNCTDFKTGKFRFESEIDGKKMVTEFERFDDIEIETFQGKTDTATVRWVSDCEYVLQKKSPKNMQERKAIGMKILSTTENSYTFEYGVVGSDQKQRGTATKIN